MLGVYFIWYHWISLSYWILIHSQQWQYTQRATSAAFSIIWRHRAHFFIFTWSNLCNLFQVNMKCWTPPAPPGLWRFHSPGKLSLVKQRNSFSDCWARLNNCTTGVGVGTWTIHPVHICCALPLPQTRQLFCYILALCGSLLGPSTFLHCQDETRRSGGGPGPQEQCLAGAYFGWAWPNKHTGTSQPQLWASPWLTFSPVTPPLAERENKWGGKRQRARAKACRG